VKAKAEFDLEAATKIKGSSYSSSNIDNLNLTRQ